MSERGVPKPSATRATAARDVNFCQMRVAHSERKRTNAGAGGAGDIAASMKAFEQMSAIFVRYANAAVGNRNFYRGRNQRARHGNGRLHQASNAQRTRRCWEVAIASAVASSP